MARPSLTRPRPVCADPPTRADRQRLVLDAALLAMAGLGTLFSLGAMLRWALVGTRPRSVCVLVATVSLFAMGIQRLVARGADVRRAGAAAAGLAFVLISGLLAFLGAERSFVAGYGIVVVLFGAYLGLRAALLGALGCTATFAGLALWQGAGASAVQGGGQSVLEDTIALGAILAAGVGIASLSRSLGEGALEREESANRELQARVLERTQDLAKANAALQADLARLTESEARLRVTGVLSGECAYRLEFGQDGGIACSWLTGALAHVTGYSPEDLQSHDDWLRIVHRDDRTLVQARVERLARGLVDHSEYRLVAASGDTVWLTDYAEPLFSPDGEDVVGALGAIRDVTAWREAQEALLDAERVETLTRLAASIAHETINPLQSVLGCIEMAGESSADPERLQRFLRVAGEEVRRASRMLCALRDLSRASDAAPSEPTDVNAVVDQVVALTARRCRDQGVQLDLSLADGLPRLVVVRDQIVQVLLNLVLNALDAMPNGGTLSIGTEVTASPLGVRIAVLDTGEGIPREVLPHIFDFFYTTKASGSGLGLPVSRNYVRRNGGTLEVETWPGKGTRLEVWLPGPEDPA